MKAKAPDSTPPNYVTLKLFNGPEQPLTVHVNEVITYTEACIVWIKTFHDGTESSMILEEFPVMVAEAFPDVEEKVRLAACDA